MLILLLSILYTILVIKSPELLITMGSFIAIVGIIGGAILSYRHAFLMSTGSLDRSEGKRLLLLNGIGTLILSIAYLYFEFY